MKRLQTLGALQLSDGDTTLLPRRRKELALLSFVARAAPEPVSRARLASLFWSERGDARARQSLRQALTDLRRALPQALDVSATDIRLSPGALAVDASEFERAVEERRLDEAVDLWRGEFLADADGLGTGDYREWVAGQRAGLRAALASACDALVDRAQRAGNWKAAIVRAEWWCARLPQDSRARARLAESLAVVGRRAEAATVGGGPEPLADRGPFAPDLVGRDDPFSALAAGWEAVLRGEARILLVEGDTGTGKTRLLEEFARFARRRAPDAPASALLLYDDAPALDAATRGDVAAFLRTPPAGSLVVLSGTPAALTTASFASAARGNRRIRRIHLDPLSRADTVRALQSVGRLEPAELRHLARHLHADTGGNPGQMIRALTLLAEEGLLVPGPDHRWQLAHGFPSGPLTLADGVKERIRGRLERATARTRRVVEATAVLGGPQSPAVIAATCGLSPEEFNESMGEALARRLLRLWSGHSHRYEFFSESVRAAVYELTPASRRRRLHRAAARALSTLFPEDPASRMAARQHRTKVGLVLRWRPDVVIARAVRHFRSVAYRQVLAPWR